MRGASPKTNYSGWQTVTCVMPKRKTVLLDLPLPTRKRKTSCVWSTIMKNKPTPCSSFALCLSRNYMTVNGFPQEVPPKYLIKTEFIDSFYGEKKKELEAQFASLSFVDRAHELGVDTFNSGKGAAVE